jgi:hypothetical protein
MSRARINPPIVGITEPTRRGGMAMTERDEQRGDPEIGVCHVCGTRFDTQRELAQHLLDAHDGDLLPTPGADGVGDASSKRHAQ